MSQYREQEKGKRKKQKPSIKEKSHPKGSGAKVPGSAMSFKMGK